MATDKTQPPIGRIVGVGALSIVILVGLQFALNSYFITMYESEEHRSVLGRPSELLQRKRSEDDEHLRSGRPMPIDQAIVAVAHGERPSAIEPRPSSEYEAMRGWGLMPRQFDPTPVAGPGQTPPAPAFDPATQLQAPPQTPPVDPTGAQPPTTEAPTAQPSAPAPSTGPLPAVLAPAGPTPVGTGSTVHLPPGPNTPVLHPTVAPAVPAARAVPAAPRPTAAPDMAAPNGQGSRPAAPPRPATPTGAP